MSLLAEEIVEEWLNRQGYFTIRGIKMGVQEIDLLAVKWQPDGSVDCRHIEVQASMRPVSYISRVPNGHGNDATPDYETCHARSLTPVPPLPEGEGYGRSLREFYAKEEQKAGRAANSAKRSAEELVQGVAEWVDKKFRRSDKKALMAKLWNGEWTSELVVNVVKSDEELGLIAARGIKIHRLNDIVSDLAKEHFVIGSASGADIVDLIHMSTIRRAQ